MCTLTVTGGRVRGGLKVQVGGYGWSTPRLQPAINDDGVKVDGPSLIIEFEDGELHNECQSKNLTSEPAVRSRRRFIAGSSWSVGEGLTCRIHLLDEGTCS